MLLKVPQKYKYLFWDVNSNNIDKERNKSFVIARVLEKAKPDALKWLFRTYSDQDIQSVIISSRNISPKTQNFWNIFFKLNVQTSL